MLTEPGGEVETATATGRLPTGKLPRWASSLARSFVTVLPTEFAIQMLTPSKATPSGPLSTGSVTTCDCVEVVCANEMPSARTTAHDAASNNPFVLRGVLLIPLSFLLMPFYSYRDRKSTRLNSSHLVISYAVFCLKKKKK